MAQITFTDREMQRAWKENLAASAVPSTVKRNNAHRLLLFYAIECGLKAVLMKRESITRTDHCDRIAEAQHDLNKLLDALGAGNRLKLPPQISMTSIGHNEERKLDCSQINQMWRYGGKVKARSGNSGTTIKDDDDLEKYLIEISKWIERELA